MVSNLFIVIVLVFISSIDVQGQYKFSDCGSASHHVKFKKLQITPHPMKIPSVPMFDLTIDVSEDLVAPIQATFVLKKKVLGFYITVPCTDGVGSCTYADWCVFCKTCNCPILQGNQIMSMPMNVTDSVPTGVYTVDISLLSATSQKGCIKITGIEVKN